VRPERALAAGAPRDAALDRGSALEPAPAPEVPAPAVAVEAAAVEAAALEAVIDAPANEALAAEPASEAEIGEIAMLEPKGEDLAVGDGAGSRRMATAPRRVPETSRVAETSSDAGPIRTRGEAYQRLAEAAEFIERSEPHSPVPHLIRRAIKWGSLSFDELLPELLQDSKLREDISRSLKQRESQE
jgi:type VI secretion system protein ImpA